MLDASAILMLLVVVVVALSAMNALLRPLARRMDRLSRIEGKLDAILKHSGVSFDPVDGVPAEAHEALKRGKKIEAIKHYRQATGAGLKEAKDVIEEAIRHIS